jgi:hypothetical protein
MKEEEGEREGKGVGGKEEEERIGRGMGYEMKG